MAGFWEAQAPRMPPIRLFIKQHALFFGGVVLLLVVDRLIKSLFLNSTLVFEPIPGWIRLEGVWNEGVAFSLPLLGSAALGVISLLLVVIGVVLAQSIRKKDARRVWGFSLILAGAGSNLADRFLWGAVLDYFRLWQFSIINLADVMIVLGVAILLIGQRHGQTISKNR